MRLLSAGLLGLGMLLSQLSVAGTPASSTQQLAAVQAAVDFCTKMDSKDAGRIERAARTVLPDMTAARVAAARKKPEFHPTYHTIGSVLEGLVASDAVRLCASAAQEAKEVPDEHEHEPKPNHRR
jgi:hypothetical protein